MRVYHPYWKLEEHKAKMWRNVTGGSQRLEYSLAAADLMRNVARFRDAMCRAVHEWPLSCEMAMTHPGVNQRAWFGHAGCCLEVNSPEELTRLGWHMLDDDEQRAANAAADDAIALWHSANGQERLFDA